MPASRQAGGTVTVAGSYVLVPNPCTTRPCLPGMAYAVQGPDALWIVTAGGDWFSEPRSWGGYTPQHGDQVTVTGVALERVDIDGQPYRTIEVKTVQPAGGDSGA